MYGASPSICRLGLGAFAGFVPGVLAAMALAALFEVFVLRASGGLVAHCDHVRNVT